MNRRHFQHYALWNLLRLALGVVLSFSWCSVAAETPEAPKGQGIASNVDQIVRQMADVFQDVKSFSADLTTVMNTQMQGVNQSMTTDYSLAVQRPNRFAMVLTNGMMGTTVVCDGAKLYTCIPMLKRYTESKAPGELSDVMTGSGALGTMSGMGGGALLGALLARDIHATLLDGVTSARYIGTEKLDDGEYLHLKFTQDSFDWDMWVKAGKPPLVRKMTMDIGQAIKGQVSGKSAPEGMGEALKDMKMTMTMEFKNWSLNADLPVSRFVFTPPEGVKKSDSLFAGVEDDEESNPLQNRTSTPPKPLPSGTNVATWASYREHLCKWYSETMIANYRRCGRRSEAWDEEVEKYYGLCAPVLAKQKQGDEFIRPLANKAAQIAALGCEDPVFEYTRGFLMLKQGLYTEAAVSLQKSKALLASSEYPRFYSFLAVRDLQATLEHLGKDKESKALNSTLYTLAARAASDGDFGNGNQRYYCQECMAQESLPRTACNILPAEFFNVALKEFSTSTNADPWIVAVIRGEYHITQAWNARGSGWADKVTDEGWKGFQTNLDLARTYLTGAQQLHPEFPEAAALMITVSMGSSEGPGEERAWFDRAVAAQLDYHGAYRGLLSALFPRWGGSHKQMLAVARECLATRRFDTSVPAIYFSVLKDIRSELENWKEVYSWTGVYEDCVAATAGYLAVEKGSDVIRWYKSNMAIIGWASGHYADAGKLLGELGDRFNPEVLSQYGVNPAEVIDETHVFIGPHAQGATDAEALAKKGQHDEALKLYEAIARDNALDSGSRAYVGSRVADLRRRTALERNEWVEVTPAANMAGWQQVDGSWSVATNGTLVGSREGTGMLKLIWNTEPGENVEFTGDVKLDRQPPAERATILLAYGGRVGAAGVGIRMTPGAVYLENNFGGGATTIKCAYSATNRLHLLLWDKKLTVQVNGINVANRRVVNEDWIGGPGLAFGEYYEGAGHHEVRIRNIKIRRLTEAPEGW